MLRRPPRSTRTDSLCPYTTLFRSDDLGINVPARAMDRQTGLVAATLAERRADALTAPIEEREFRHGLLLLAFLAENVLARSEEHTSELQSLMRISYAVCCLKKTNTTYTDQRNRTASVSTLHT